MATQRVVQILQKALRQYKLTKAAVKEEQAIEEAEIFIDTLHDCYDNDEEQELDDEPSDNDGRTLDYASGPGESEDSAPW